MSDFPSPRRGFKEKCVFFCFLPFAVQVRPTMGGLWAVMQLQWAMGCNLWHGTTLFAKMHRLIKNAKFRLTNKIILY